MDCLQPLEKSMTMGNTVFALLSKDTMSIIIINETWVLCPTQKGIREGEVQDLKKKQQQQMNCNFL